LNSYTEKRPEKIRKNDKAWYLAKLAVTKAEYLVKQQSAIIGSHKISFLTHQRKGISVVEGNSTPLMSFLKHLETISGLVVNCDCDSTYEHKKEALSYDKID